MPKLQIRNHQTGIVLYEGNFTDARRCVEQAVRENICLDYADLRYANLSHAALDDIIVRNARLDHANLTGANLSEAQLSGTNFSYAALQAACLCYSSLDNCNFDSALFGATDIAGCAVQKARFSALSAFTLNFIDTKIMDNCLYRSSAGVCCPLSKPPLIIQGLSAPVVFMDMHLKIGCMVKTYREWLSHTNDNIPEGSASHIHVFMKEYLSLFLKLCEGKNILDTGCHKIMAG